MSGYHINVFAVLLGLSACAICWGLLSPVHALPAWSRSHDKLLHVGAFAFLAVLANLWLPEAPVWGLWGMLVLAGLAGEVAQHFSVHRRFCWRDAVANAIGAAAGLGGVQWALTLPGWSWLLS
jgi:hypothetical protein